MPVPFAASYSRGVFLVLVGGFFLSLAGILLRQVESADGWQILFYRSISFFATLSLILWFKYRDTTVAAFRSVGARGLAAAIVLGLGSVSYVFALLNTTVANAVFIIGASPLVTALIGWVFLRERVWAASVVAMFGALAGIGLMFADGLVDGGTLGNLMALGVVASFSVFLLIVRGSKDLDMLPATCLAGLVAGAIAAAMADSLAVTGSDLVIGLLLGSVQFTGGFMLLTIGARHLPAAEVALFSLSEAVLAPLWVWLGVNETPSLLALAGASVVLLSVIGYCVIGIRRRSRTTSNGSAE
ncbi:MAG: DMT family transporter [Proteobacteria bacterium]|nr:MAG: DMT family transporter [Pseudomonadota bacterium]